MRRLGLGLPVIGLLLLALLPASALAAFPGTNGKIAIGVNPYDTNLPDRIDTRTLDEGDTGSLAREVGKLQGFGFSPDGTKLFGYYGDSTNPSIGRGMYVADPNGMELTRVFPGASRVAAGFLPDGRFLYLQGRSLQMVNGDGTGQVAVLPGVQLPVSAGGFAIAPDGRSIYYATAGWETTTDQVTRDGAAANQGF